MSRIDRLNDSIENIIDAFLPIFRTGYDIALNAAPAAFAAFGAMAFASIGAASQVWPYQYPRAALLVISGAATTGAIYWSSVVVVRAACTMNTQSRTKWYVVYPIGILTFIMIFRSFELFHEKIVPTAAKLLICASYEQGICTAQDKDFKDSESLRLLFIAAFPERVIRAKEVVEFLRKQQEQATRPGIGSESMAATP